MSIGKGIAIAGIWVGVAVVSFGAGVACEPVALMAMIATNCVALS